MSYDHLRQEVFRVNKAIVEAGLVVLTWGNASGVDRDKGVMAIKPSGVAYESLEPEDIVVLSLESGKVVVGDLSPSSDAPTHLALYRSFAEVGGIVHTHSTYATAWSQAGTDLPCMGTTQADHFRGPVPLARVLTTDELRSYEQATGEAIVECLRRKGIAPLEVPAVLVPHHGPFVWGTDPGHALENAVALEEVAKMATLSLTINPHAAVIPGNLLRKHFDRKHGPGAYYGQGRKNSGRRIS